MRKPFVAGNWKMNKTGAEARRLVSEMLGDLTNIPDVERVLCPPFLALPAVASRLEGTAVGIGAQDMYWEEAGAYTGEVSPSMVAELCQFVIVGHSERRAYFHETDETVNLKVKAALAHGLVPIVCVGETLDENEAGQTAQVVSRQMRAGLGGLSDMHGDEFIVAYEPVWAIGTGRAATAEGANAVIRDVIRRSLAELFGPAAAGAVRVLYGGSVKGDNAREIFDQPDIDGGLIGGASLNASEFIQIVRAVVP